MVKRYLRYKLSFLDLVEMMEKRGLSIVNATIMCWIHLDALELEK